MVNIRHGDLALIEIKELPNGLKENRTKIILEGKSNKHTFDAGKLYLNRVDDFIFGFFVATDKTHLLHIEHGKVKVPKGIYELRVQHEYTNDGMKQVVD